MSEIRNIVLIGRTGNGKSTLANVIGNMNRFKESDLGVSETKNIQIEKVEVEGITYRLIDTIGIGDTRLSNQEVLNKIADAAYEVKDGLSQLLFVTSGRFTEEEIDAYDLLRTVIFDQNIAKCTTIVRTKFSRFRKPEKCKEDTDAMIKENSKLAEVIGSCNKVIHVDNPSIVDLEDEDEINVNENIREKSRIILLTHLYACRDNYKPENLDQLNDRIKNHMTVKEQLQVQIEEMNAKEEEYKRRFGEASKQVEEVKTIMKSLVQKHEKEKKELAETMERQIREARNATPQIVERHHYHYRESERRGICSIQ
ncbi:hypothetical protein Glove_529g53 [Diversispora epigaea]|uniref:AIG1-type G domain-containing protein n=1 Tax=Diversispora epigaea TaxID=1348612 RepID=A0A397GDM2_9GLOM|nr:hypothetical protein Glove_529g53 [Diversispora epigaea]